MLREHRVAGSNPVSPTTLKPSPSGWVSSFSGPCPRLPDHSPRLSTGQPFGVGFFVLGRPDSGCRGSSAHAPPPAAPDALRSFSAGNVGLRVEAVGGRFVVAEAVGPAAKRGLRPGDVILASNGTPVEEWTAGHLTLHWRGGAPSPGAGPARGEGLHHDHPSPQAVLSDQGPPPGPPGADPGPRAPGRLRRAPARFAALRTGSTRRSCPPRRCPRRSPSSRRGIARGSTACRTS